MKHFIWSVCTRVWMNLVTGTRVNVLLTSQQNSAPCVYALLHLIASKCVIIVISLGGTDLLCVCTAIWHMQRDHLKSSFCFTVWAIMIHTLLCASWPSVHCDGTFMWYIETVRGIWLSIMVVCISRTLTSFWPSRWRCWLTFKNERYGQV